MLAPSSSLPTTRSQLSKSVAIDLSEIDHLIGRVEQAINNSADHSLKVADLEQLLAALKTLLHLHERLEANDLTLAKMRRLLGLIPQVKKRLSHGKGISKQSRSEVGSDDNGEPGPAALAPRNRTPHGPRGRDDFPGARIEHHAFFRDTGDGSAGQGVTTKGDLCPECGRGRLYKYDPAEFVRISAAAPLRATIHVSERLRCNLCQHIFQAPLPGEVRSDGAPGQRFGYSARSFIVVAKYLAGTPWYRQQTLQRMLGLELSASTLWDQSEAVANDIKPVFDVLLREAAGAWLYFCDDTRARIIGQEPVMRLKRGTKTEQLRSGINTSAIRAVVCAKKGAAGDSDHIINLFKTGINHAGEFFDEILRLRPSGTDPPLHMSDGLSANVPTVAGVLSVRCNAHTLREFEELTERFPDEVTYVQEVYAKVYAHEKEALTRGMSAEERLEWHKSQSLPLMTEMMAWMRGKLARREVEPNSALGDAFSYVLKRERELAGFCTLLGAPLDNNPCERLLKTVVLHRKNSLFFRCPAGAWVADVLLSVMKTAVEVPGLNIMHYLTHLQRCSVSVKKDPGAFLPWIYITEQTSSAPESVQETTDF